MEPFTFTHLSPDDPWNQCLAHFFRHLLHRSGSTSTYHSYHCYIRLFFSREPQKHPAQYTSADVLTFIHGPVTSNRNRGAPPTVSTVNLRTMALRSFYRFAIAYDLSTIDPTRGVEYARPKSKHRVLSPDETRAFFAAIPKDTVRGARDRAIFLTFFYTARRRSEIARLTFGDIEQGVIVEQDGTRRSGWLYHFQGKGRSRVDDIAELPAPAKAAIDAYLELSGRIGHIKAESPLWITIEKRFGHDAPMGHTMSDWAISRAMKTYARSAGIEAQGLSPHVWRHTSARRRHEAGEDILSIQKLLRHSSLDMTYRYLSELSGSADPGAKLLEAQFGDL